MSQVSAHPTSIQRERSKSLSYEPTYYSKNIKSISSDDYQYQKNSTTSNHNHHQKSISSDDYNKSHQKSFSSDDYQKKSGGLSSSTSSTNKYSNQNHSSNNRPRFISTSGKENKSSNTKSFSTNTSGNSVPTYSSNNSSFGNNGVSPSPSPSPSSSSSSSSTTTTNSPQSPNNKSRMKRLSLTVSVSTQKYLEKMGKTSDTTVDSDDIRRKKNLLKGFKKDCKGITKVLRSNLFAHEKNNNGIQLGESMVEFGEGALKNTSEGEALRELGNQLVDFENDKKDGNMGILTGFLEPIIEFYDGDIKKARELKRKQNVVRIRYEQSQNNLHEVRKKNDPYSSKTKQAKSDEEESKANYNQITREFLDKMNDNETNFKLQVRKQIREFVQMQIEFYRESLESWEEFAEDLDEIIPSTIEEQDAREKEYKKKLEAAENDDGSDEENDDDLLKDL
ncbi:hypothetical protein CYY_006998 [Polysphondylium violaceum]|uniref:BAR domain-containing protein n=1 Tax=Polysphondylium violaceum TaxID=133409 RepID=A0A8J4PPC1_9MYCE|nr:hypothetical protein CYY_006998 [Polysphondylium violaceum]